MLSSPPLRGLLFLPLPHERLHPCFLTEHMPQEVVPASLKAIDFIAARAHPERLKGLFEPKNQPFAGLAGRRGSRSSLPQAACALGKAKNTHQNRL